ncbi:MAG: NAD(P)/FAD-dependent oxidoreductase [Candidatus Pacebacteria bacterium]|nr:NAD(P)/FAD-dependent oxidoreductase [Candidatus Paceibacterota bacterium]
MNTTKYVLIGAGLASAEAVKGIRKHDKDGDILLVGAEPHLPYNRPPLSKDLLKGSKTRADIFCEDEGFYREAGVELKLGHTVTGLDAKKHTLTMDDGEERRFEKALLATGGSTVQLPHVSAEIEGVHYLRTVDDAESLERVARRTREAVVVGAGFIGMEVSATLTQMGVKVTVLEAQEHIWPRFAAPRLADAIQSYYEDKGVAFITGDKLSRLNAAPAVTSVTTESGREISCQLVCCAVGIKPDIDLGLEAGLDHENGLFVDKTMRTSHPDIYAAGDIANFPDPYFGKRRRVEHWGQAEYSGGLAGENMAGADKPYDLLTYAWSEGFDLHYEFGGDEGSVGSVIWRGEFPYPNFVCFHVRDNRISAFIAVNPDDALLGPLETLVKKRIDAAPVRRQLADPDASLTDVVSAIKSA